MFSASKTAGPSGYNINNSLRFRASASAYLTRTLGAASSRTTWTYSFWFKRGLLNGTYYILSNGNGNANNTEESLYFESGNQLTFINVTQNVAVNWAITTTQVFRDPSAWYHLVIAVDTTQATASNRIKFYVNGSQITAFSSASYPAQNANTTQGASGLVNEINRRAQVASNYGDIYFAEFNFVTGQALTPSSFGSTNATTGVWQPAKYTGSYGTNGFYLPFSDIGLTSGSNTGLGKDFSGNGNYFNTNNISVTAGTTYDAMTDSPTLTSATVANYCILNPLSQAASGASYLSQGNLYMFDNSSAAAWRTVFGSHGINIGDGKFYWETTAGPFGASVGGYTGICSQTDNGAPPQTTDVALYWNNAGNFQKERNGSNTALSGTPVAGDVLGVAYDAVNGQIWFSRNGTYFEGNPSAGTGASYTGITIAARPFLSIFSNVGQMSASINFGQRPFAYTPPTGFVALNTFNLPNSTVVKGNSYMNATLYTGTTTGTGQTQTISHGQSFTPNLVWIKNRSAAHSHQLYDVIRGYGSNKNLKSNSSDEEGLYGDTNGYVSAVSSSQITTVSGSNATAYGEFVNQNTRTYVGWLWAANGAGVTNTSGSITSTVSVNATAGFSIVTYTGTGSAASIGHGLGVTPEFIMVKRRNVASNWMVVSKYLTNYNWYLKLNLTDAQVGDATIGNIDPTPTIFNVGTNAIDNASGGTYVAYVWAPIAGFSRFGSYTGNGSTDGPFIYTGFRTRYLLIKCTSTAEQWAIKDTALVPYNTNNTQFFANATDPETTDNTYHMIDFVSNGFKIRGAAQNLVNGNGQNYIYMAFAENPFKNALAR